MFPEKGKDLLSFIYFHFLLLQCIISAIHVTYFYKTDLSVPAVKKTKIQTVGSKCLDKIFS